MSDASDAGPILTSLEQHWNELSADWRKTRADLNAKSVHDLRVAARRLTASLALLHSVLQRVCPDLRWDKSTPTCGLRRVYRRNKRGSLGTVLVCGSRPGSVSGA